MFGKLTNKLKAPVSLSSVFKETFEIEGTRYSVLNQIGEGGFAYVYRVKKANLIKSNTPEDHYAVKKILCQLDEQIEDAEIELSVLKAIRHEHVMPLLASEKHVNKKGHTEVLLLLPLYGATVQTILDANARGCPHCPFDDGTAILAILKGAVEGLIALHDAGWRHGDLKPANILLTADTRKAVLTDFGSCAPVSVTVTSRREALLVQDHAATSTTASIRAPELHDTPSNGVTIDDKADVWAVGCTWFSMMFNRTPFEDPQQGLSTLALLAGAYEIPLGHAFPGEWVDVLGLCLRPDLKARLDTKAVLARLHTLPSAPESLSIRATSELDTNAGNAAPMRERASPNARDKVQDKHAAAEVVLPAHTADIDIEVGDTSWVDAAMESTGGSEESSTPEEAGVKATEGAEGRQEDGGLGDGDASRGFEADFGDLSEADFGDLSETVEEKEGEDFGDFEAATRESFGDVCLPPSLPVPPPTELSDDEGGLVRSPPAATVSAKTPSNTSGAISSGTMANKDGGVRDAGDIPFHELSVLEKETQIKRLSKVDASFVGCDDDEGSGSE